MRGGPNGGVHSPSNLALYTYGWSNPVKIHDPDGRAGRDGTDGAPQGGHDPVQAYFDRIDEHLEAANEAINKINEQLTVFEAEEGQRSPRDAAFAKVSLGNIHGDQLEKAYAIYTNVVVTVATAGVFAEGAGVLAPEIKTGVTPYQVGRWNTMNSAGTGSTYTTWGRRTRWSSLFLGTHARQGRQLRCQELSMP